MVLIIILLGVFILFAGIVAPSKYLQITGALVLCLLMILLSGLRYDGADISGYQYEFYNSVNFGWDIWNENISEKEIRQFGQLYLNKFFYEAGYTFGEMRFCAISLMMIVLFIMLSVMTSKWPVVIFLYLIFPFPLDAVQTRNFFMEVCVLGAIYLYAVAKTRHNMKYIGMLTLGASFHTMAIAYLPYLLFEKFKKYGWWYKISMIISTASPIYAKFLISNAVVILISIAIDDSPLSRYMDYVEGRTSDASADPYTYFLHTWLLVIVFFIYSTYLAKKTYSRWGNAEHPSKIRFIYTMNNMWKYCLLLLPVISLTPSLDRIPRNLLLPFYVALGIYFTYVDNRYYKWLILLCAITIVAYSGIYSKSDFEFLITNFTHNYLFE